MYKPPSTDAGAAVDAAPPACEIVTIGDELGRGEIVDSNTAWLAEQATALGLHVRYRGGVNDRMDDMLAALRQASGRARVVLVSGGLGPTEDDLTVDAASALCGALPAQEPEHEARMRARFAERGFTLTPNNLRQVRVPTGAQVLPNPAGLAPGFRVEHGGASLFFFPGVPRELKPMFTESAAPLLRALAPAAGWAARRTWRVIGLGESHVDHRLRGVLDEAPAELRGRQARPPTLHFRILFPETLVTVVAAGADEAAAEALLSHLDGALRARLGGAIYSEGQDDLPIVVGRKLRERGQTAAVAESCTGGLLGALLTAVPGSSDYFLGGVISYANEVKQQVLGVRQETLMAHGAVSEACVREMAEGARRLLGATYGLAISGVAGPGGGSADKPVGTVHVAVAGPAETVARKLLWPGDREQVRRIGAMAALNILDKILSPERAAPRSDGLQERLG